MEIPNMVSKLNDVTIIATDRDPEYGKKTISQSLRPTAVLNVTIFTTDDSTKCHNFHNR